MPEPFHYAFLISIQIIMASTCCDTIPKVEPNYMPKGSEIQISAPGGDLKIYETGTNNVDKLLIAVYDIFGFHNNTKQFADKLGEAACSYKVVMPEFYRETPFPLSKFPPKPMKVLRDWIAIISSYSQNIKPDIDRVLKYYKGKGARQIGIFGFCLGAKLCTSISSDFKDDLKAEVLLHPAQLIMDDAEKASIPTLLLPSKDEPDLIPFYERMKAKFGDQGSGHHRFEDMNHGFAGARGNTETALNRQRIDEALQFTCEFLQRFVK